MAIALGRVVAGAMPLSQDQGKGVNATYVGNVDLDNGTRVRAYIKDLPPTQLANEVLAATLARSSGVPVPLPVLAVASPNDLAVRHGPAQDPSNPNGPRLVFASADEQGRSIQVLLKQNSWLSAALSSQLRSWRHLPGAIAFDCWIANGDRHDGNLLLQNGEFVLIDHSHAFTGPTWTAASLVVNQNVSNKLICMFYADARSEAFFKPMCVGVEAQASKFRMIEINQEIVGAQIWHILSPAEISAMKDFLEQRRGQVASIVCAQFGRARLIP
jgi:hypothetical protein